MEGLDAPTVFRAGSPTLGLPVMQLAYRPDGEGMTPSVGSIPPEPLPAPEIGVHPLLWRLAALEVRVALLERPWHVRLLAWLKGFFSHGE